MDSDGYKRYTAQAKSGIRGEAFFELLITDYALPHRIVGSKDIGIDYICEWVYGDKPTGILFIVQIKTFASANPKPKYVGINQNYNGLEQYQIHHKILEIDPRTLQYWKGLGIPAYLFVVVQKANGEEMSCFYRRYTHPLTAISADPSGKYYEGFYKVNKGTSFLAFKDPEKRIQGFARDLFVDHVRWSYAKGLITYLDPGSMGLNQFQTDAVFIDLFKDYENQIRSTHSKTSHYLKVLSSQMRQPDQPLRQTATSPHQDIPAAPAKS